MTHRNRTNNNMQVHKVHVHLRQKNNFKKNKKKKPLFNVCP